MVLMFDIDGVLGSFVKPARALAEEMQASPDLGGSPEEMDQRLWQAAIQLSPTFWMDIPSLASGEEWERIARLARVHNVYFATNRYGYQAKRQTETWLNMHGVRFPTVLLTKFKAETARVLGAEYSIDDKAGNAMAISWLSPTTRSYLLNTPRNQFDPKVAGSKVIRITTLGEFLDVVEDT